jgi:hypothetical protein
VEVDVTSGFTFTLPNELVEEIVDRVLERIADRLPAADDGWLRGAEAIANYIGAPASRVYALHSAGRLPLAKDGSALVARRRDLDDFITNGGARRP